SKALFHDRSFHTTLVSAARIPVISGTHERILAQTHTVFVSILGDYARSVEEHQNIADAIAA
ncbi:FCD domain-containing protein, partial [Rhizobium sp. BR5]